MSLAIHGTLFAGLSLWSVATFGGRREVRTARLALVEAGEPVPVVEHEPLPSVEPPADFSAAEPPELVPVEAPVEPAPMPEDLAGEEPPEAPEELAALEPSHLPLQPLIRPAPAEPLPEASVPAQDEVTQQEVEAVERAGEDENRKPVLIDAPAPRYPPIALRRGWQGMVVLRLWVATDGTVADVAVERSSGFAIFDESALDAVRRWRFEPGRTRTVEVLHRVRFQLVADG